MDLDKYLCQQHLISTSFLESARLSASSVILTLPPTGLPLQWSIIAAHTRRMSARGKEVIRYAVKWLCNTWSLRPYHVNNTAGFQSAKFKDGRSPVLVYKCLHQAPWSAWPSASLLGQLVCDGCIYQRSTSVTIWGVWTLEPFWTRTLSIGQCSFAHETVCLQHFDSYTSTVYRPTVVVCLSVRMSVTRRYCTKTVKLMITQIPHDSAWTL